MAKMTLARALSLQTALTAKVRQLETINQDGLFEVRLKRQSVTEGIDDLQASVPKISIQQVTHAYDWHAKRLRMLKDAVQKANHTLEIDLEDAVIEEYTDPYVESK